MVAMVELLMMVALIGQSLQSLGAGLVLCAAGVWLWKRRGL